MLIQSGRLYSTAQKNTKKSLYTHTITQSKVQGIDKREEIKKQTETINERTKGKSLKL